MENQRLFFYSYSRINGFGAPSLAQDSLPTVFHLPTCLQFRLITWWCKIFLASVLFCMFRIATSQLAMTLLGNMDGCALSNWGLPYRKVALVSPIFFKAKNRVAPTSGPTGSEEDPSLAEECVNLLVFSVVRNHLHHPLPWICSPSSAYTEEFQNVPVWRSRFFFRTGFGPEMHIQELQGKYLSNAFNVHRRNDLTGQLWAALR